MSGVDRVRWRTPETFCHRYHTELNGNVRSYFFPRAGDSTSTDLIYNMLNENVTASTDPMCR
ncbi:hypothetical protein J2S43_004545 [Catenuloplanes nepalensis]|uniref:Uncharacterized protein n=1 Tax=Catenuloplanes nepalensis TaxID=587533 RepID=A0ABT9MX85_9ACTN|nr:hypothetical protein [Catenuloplanes nepalensis]MDP9796033.1 hypothetical protein [Catenuloplanes nepalensis]